MSEFTDDMRTAIDEGDSTGFDDRVVIQDDNILELETARIELARLQQCLNDLFEQRPVVNAMAQRAKQQAVGQAMLEDHDEQMRDAAIAIEAQQHVVDGLKAKMEESQWPAAARQKVANLETIVSELEAKLRELQATTSAEMIRCEREISQLKGKVAAQEKEIGSLKSEVARFEAIASATAPTPSSSSSPAPPSPASPSSPATIASAAFGVGAAVVIEANVRRARVVCASHSSVEFTPGKEGDCGKTGVVTQIDDSDNTILVHAEGQEAARWWPRQLVRRALKVGDVVQLEGDADCCKSVLARYPMIQPRAERDLCRGKQGQVVEVDNSDGTVKVRADGDKSDLWWPQELTSLVRRSTAGSAPATESASSAAAASSPSSSSSSSSTPPSAGTSTFRLPSFSVGDKVKIDLGVDRCREECLKRRNFTFPAEKQAECGKTGTITLIDKSDDTVKVLADGSLIPLWWPAQVVQHVLAVGHRVVMEGNAQRCRSVCAAYPTRITMGSDKTSMCGQHGVIVEVDTSDSTVKVRANDSMTWWPMVLVQKI